MPPRRSGLNSPFTSICPCSIWSTAFSALSCRMAPAIKTAEGPANNTGFSCATAWATSIPFWRTPDAGTPCSTEGPRPEPAFSGNSVNWASSASAWNCWTIPPPKHAASSPATAACWTGPVPPPGSSGNWMSRNSSARRKERFARNSTPRRPPQPKGCFGKQVPEKTGMKNAPPVS